MSSADRFLLAGVMGWPVMHSRSPALHNYFFSHYGLAGTYVPLAIKAEGLEAALRALAPLGFAGCNLTIPHKERALAFVDEVDDVVTDPTPSWQSADNYNCSRPFPAIDHVVVAINPDDPARGL